MKKWAGFACGTAFVLLCVGVWLFFQPLTETKGTIPYIEWESACLVSAGGEESPLDPMAPQPELGPGECFRFSLTLPDRDTSECLVFESGGGSIALFLNGQSIYASQVPSNEAALDSTQAQVALSPGGGESLVMELVPDGQLPIFPPLLRLTEDPSAQEDTIAYANYYTIPAVFAAIITLLVWGLFLLRLYERSPSWRLLLVVFAGVVAVVYPLVRGFGSNFFSPFGQRFLGWQGWPVLQIAALAVFLLLHREKAFWRGISLVAGVSALTLGILWGASALTGGYLARYMDSLLGQVFTGIYVNLLYWISFWMILVCALVSGWYFVRAIVRTQGENRALQVKDQLLLENYRALEGRLEEIAALRHESAHQLAAMEALLREKNYYRLHEMLQTWHHEIDRLTPQYSRNHMVNAILQNTYSQAKACHVDFTAKVHVPEELPLPHEDLCAFLMNLLENAVEAASQVAPGKERFIRIQMSVRNGFLAIQCENTFQGPLVEKREGGLLSRKSHPEFHGFGIAKMRAVAEKYKSILDISYTDTVFTVQTALKLPQGHAEA